MRITRRKALKGMGGVALGTALGTALGCATSATPGETPEQPGDPVAPGPGAPDLATPPDAASPSGASCTATGGLTPEQLLAPIDTFVVLCMENRSFDHMLGGLTLEGRAVDGLQPAMSNPDAMGLPVAVYPETELRLEDLPHSWDGSHAQWNGGANDGFVTTGAGHAMAYYTRSQLPAIYGLADQFTVCDRWFCSVLGPTWPNRFFLHGATSMGRTKNEVAYFFKSIFHALGEKGLTGTNYYHDVAWAAGAYTKLDGLVPVERFFADAQAGTLPNLSIVDPLFLGPFANDDHPDHDVGKGQALIATVFNALVNSPQWNRCMFIVTYDEHGGFFDHVAPPTTVDERPSFAQLGFRVPAVVAGPHVRRGCTVSTVLDHVSVIATLTRRFGLTPLNARVSATADLSSCIDPALLATPMAGLPVSVDLSRTRLRSRPDAGDHPELREALRRGRIPRALDRRREAGEILERVLREGERLGAIRGRRLSTVA
jgi:phospholipase C